MHMDVLRTYVILILALEATKETHPEAAETVKRSLLRVCEPERTD